MPSFRFLSRLREYIDAELFDRISATDAEKMFSNLDYDDGSTTVQQINLELTGLNSKTSTLLTHVSLMITAFSVIYNTQPPLIIRILILIVILIYSCSLLPILRAIWMPETIYEVSDERKHLLLQELAYTNQYYRIAHQTVFLLTCIGILLFAVLMAADFVRSS